MNQNEIRLFYEIILDDIKLFLGPLQPKQTWVPLDLCQYNGFQVKKIKYKQILNLIT